MLIDKGMFSWHTSYEIVCLCFLRYESRVFQPTASLRYFIETSVLASVTLNAA